MMRDSVMDDQGKNPLEVWEWLWVPLMGSGGPTIMGVPGPKSLIRGS